MCESLMLPAPAYLGRKARERMVTPQQEAPIDKGKCEPKKGSSIRMMKKA